MDVIRKKLNYSDLKARMLRAAEEHNPSVILVEDTGVGTGLIAELRKEALNVVEVTATQSKEARAAIETPKFESKRVVFPKSAPWLSAFEAELLAFPGSRHDDEVDSMVHALAYEQVERVGVDYIYLDRPKRRNYNDWWCM